MAYKNPDMHSSARLIYRAADDPALAGVFTMFMSDSFANAMADDALPKPRGQDTAASRAEHFKLRALIGAVICLKPSDYGAPLTQRYDENFKEKEKLKPIGIIHLTATKSSHHRCASIGLRIIEEARGLGYGAESIRWILEFGFKYCGLHRIEIVAYGWNEPARGLYKKLGFIDEGFERQSLWYEGKWWGVWNMAMLEDEWWAMQKKEADSKIKQE